VLRQAHLHVDPEAGWDLPMDWDRTIVPVGRHPEGFEVTPDRKQLWVANAADGTVSIIDIATEIVRKIVEQRLGAQDSPLGAAVAPSRSEKPRKRGRRVV
jgi:YVTN family beta-propeller protein